MEDGPRVARPGFVSMIPGGRQVFPHDPVADATRNQQVKRDAKRLGVQLIRRRTTKEEADV